MTRSVFALTLSDELCLTNNKILQCLDKTCMENIDHVFNHVCQSWVTLVSKIWCRGQSWHLDRWVSCLWLNVKKKKNTTQTIVLFKLSLITEASPVTQWGQRAFIYLLPLFLSHGHYLMTLGVDCPHSDLCWECAPPTLIIIILLLPLPG